MVANKKTLGQVVTVEEVNYLVTKLRELRADIESNQRQLNMIEEQFRSKLEVNKRHLNAIKNRLGILEDTVEGFDIVVDQEENEP